MKKKSVKSINQCQSVIQTTHDIVKAHGGSLSVESKSGEGLPTDQTGSIFSIRLPVV